MAERRGHRGIELPDEARVPPGAHRDLLIELHKLYVAAGRPGVRTIANGIVEDDSLAATINYRTVGKILNGTVLASRRQIQTISVWLAREANVEDSQYSISALMRLWQSAEEARLSVLRRSDIGEVRSETSPDTPEIEGDADVPTSNQNKVSDTPEKVDLEAERRVLAAMLKSPDATADIIEIISAQDFYDLDNRETFRAICLLHSEDPRSVNFSAVVHELQDYRVGDFDGVGYLRGIVEIETNPRDAERDAEIMRRASLLRALKEVGARIASIGSTELPDAGGDEDALIDSAEEEVQKLVQRYSPKLDAGYRWEVVLDEIEALGAMPHHPSGVPSGFPKLDAIIGGFKPGKLIILASASAIGKSTLGLDFIRSSAIAHKMPSAIFSLESEEVEISKRVLAAESRVPVNRVNSGTLTDDDWTKVARRMADVTSAPLHIFDQTDLTVELVVRQCRRLWRRQGLRLALVDTIQALSMQPERGGSALNLTTLLHQFRTMAREINLPVICTARLEYPNGRPDVHDRRPKLDYLAPALVEMADVVILLHREDAYDLESPRAGEADLIIAKHRDGPTAVVTVAFQGHYSRFVDMGES